MTDNPYAHMTVGAFIVLSFAALFIAGVATLCFKVVQSYRRPSGKPRSSTQSIKGVAK